MKVRESYSEGFKLYPWHMANHHAQGCAVAIMVLIGGIHWWVLAGIWTVSYLYYQKLSQIRKKDAAGLDVMDFMVGAIPGMVIGAFLRIYLHGGLL